MQKNYFLFSSSSHKLSNIGLLQSILFYLLYTKRLRAKIQTWGKMIHKLFSALKPSRFFFLQLSFQQDSIFFSSAETRHRASLIQTCYIDLLMLCYNGDEKSKKPKVSISYIKAKCTNLLVKVPNTTVTCRYQKLTRFGTLDVVGCLIVRQHFQINEA